MRLQDTAAGYGWISIGLHWLGAAVVLALWFAGSRIPAAGGGADAAIRLHTTIALAAYLLLTLRVVWRFRAGHPGPLPRQGKASFRTGKIVHYLILVGLGVMLVSGPLMAWTGAVPLRFLDLAIPSPLPPSTVAFNALHSLHQVGATMIIAATGLHVLGVFKHVVFNGDGTLDKIMVPAAATVVRSRESPVPPIEGNGGRSARPMGEPEAVSAS
jgi:cytochrome b561